MSRSPLPWPARHLLRLGDWVAEVDRRSLRADAVAGLLGAVLVLPQAVAFAALAGLPPSMGLVAAVLPCAVAALAGSSRHVLTGPTNATALALGTMLATLGSGVADGGVGGAVGAGLGGAVAGMPLPLLALALTMLVGLLQLALAAARLGVLANFVSPSVMLGFTSGAALLIGWYALAGVLGASGRQSPLAAWQQGPPAAALAVGGLTLLVALAGRRWARRTPYLLVALLAGLALAWAIERGGWHLPGLGPGPGPGLAAAAPGGDAATAAPLLRLRTPPQALPQWQWPLPPLAHWAGLMPQLLAMALALTIVALGQSLAIAKALAQRSGDALAPNREVLGQGLANLVAGLGGGMLVCGSLNRSLPNLEAGARTPLAGVFAAGWLLLLVALAGPLLAWIPLAGVSALLLVVAWSLLDGAAWARLWRLARAEFGVAALTLAATLLLRLEVAVLAGVMVSLVVYLYRSARPALRTMGFDRSDAGRPFVVLDDAPAGARPECPQLKLLRMEGSVWFGAVPHVAEGLRALRRPAPGEPLQPHLLVMGKSMNFIDLAGADLWDDERIRRAELGGALYFHRPRPAVLALWQRTGFLQRLGAQRVFPDKRRALAAIVPQLDPAVCARCSRRVFEECADRPGAPLAPSI